MNEHPSVCSTLFGHFLLTSAQECTMPPKGYLVVWYIRPGVPQGSQNLLARASATSSKDLLREVNVQQEARVGYI